MAGERRLFDGTLIFLIAVLAAVAALAHWRGGSDAVAQGFGEGWATLVRFGPMIVVSFLAAGFADQLIPPEWVRVQLGADNRSVSFTTDFPSARTLLASGIRRGLLVQLAADQPQPDLAHTLRAWQEAGIALALCRLDASGEPVPLTVDKPRRFGALCYRASLLFRMRRYPLGGFGGVVPEPIEGAGFAG